MNQSGFVSRYLRVWAVPGLLLCAGPAAAAGVSMRVLDQDGVPVPEVAIVARQLDHTDPAAAPVNTPLTAVMNQHELAFNPHLLIVMTGTRIEFPNNDEVRHHVYSFSPVKRFDFSIAAGSVHEVLEFDTPGVVTLGCNIHDDMLGYILVVDSPYFDKTDASGTVSFDELAPGRYSLEIWTPRISSKHLPEPVVITIADGESASLEYRFEKKLYPPHKHSATSLEWNAY